MTLTPAMTGVLPVRIAGLGSYLPDQVVKNAEFEAYMDTSDEWIKSRTGIEQRHKNAPDQATSDLAVAAATRALADAHMTIDEINMIIVATTTPDYSVPGTAPIVAATLGSNATAFDLNAACSGFLYGLQVGGALVTQGFGPVLLIGAESLSRIVDPQDRSVAILFGDGAGAAVLVHDDTAALGPFALGADGSDPTMLWTPAGGTRTPTDETVVAQKTHRLAMRGGDVYRNAVTRMTEASQVVLGKAGLSVNDIDLFVGHQANIRILDAVAQRLSIPSDKIHVTVNKHGNTSAASIPLALTDARDTARLKAGDTVLIAAFGAGLTYGACLMTFSAPTKGS